MRYDSLGGAKAIRYGVNIKKPEKKIPISCVALRGKRIFNKKIMKNKNVVLQVHVLLIALLFL